MADRLIANSLGKYLSVFIKNWSKDALSLSFLRGEGVLNNLEFNEEVVQEVLSIPFLQVQRVHVNQLRCKLPSLTRLNNDPLCIMMDHVTVEIIEPVAARPITTPLADFIKSMASSSSSSSSSAKESTKKYGFIEKMIDGVSVEVKRVTFVVKTLGPNPSQVIGDWTPPYLKVELMDFKLVATNANWNVVDLKYALPKYDKNNPILTLYKRGTMKSLSVHLIHPTNQYQSQQQQQRQQQHPHHQQQTAAHRSPTNIKSSSSSSSSTTPGPNEQQTGNVTLIDHISASIRITHKKKAIGGKPMGAKIDVLLGDVNISLDQTDLTFVIRFLMGFQAASQRQDLIGPHVEFMKKKLERERRFTSNTSTSTSTTANSGRTTAALSKFISKKQNETKDEEVDFDMLTDDTDDTDVAEMNTPASTPSPTSASTSAKTVEDETSQVRVNIVLNNCKALFRNGPIGYLAEVFGFNLNIIALSDSIDKHIEMVIPYCHFRQMTSTSKHDIVDASGNEDDIMLENLIGPKLKHVIYNETVERIEKENQKYTIDYQLWPEFFEDPMERGSVRKKRRYDTFMQNPYSLTYKHKFFEEGREMVRFKFVVAPQTKDFVFELRVNPVQVVAHVKKLINLTEYILGSFPDLSVVPPEDKRITFPVYVPPDTKRVKKRHNDRELDDDEVSSDNEIEDTKVSFVIEVREPSIFIPSNSEMSDFSGISEMLQVSSREVIVTSDPRIHRPDWTEEDQETLFVPKMEPESNTYSFPTSGEDFTVFHRALWEVLPVKLKFNLNDFVIDLLPSFTAPPQKIMEPLSVSFELGVNDQQMSDFHKKIPLVVIMTRIHELNFHFTQNQCILLLDLAKTYLDDPPEISALLLKNTKKFARANHEIIMSQRRRRRRGSLLKDDHSTDDLSDSMTASDDEMTDDANSAERAGKEVVPLLVLCKLDKLALSISLSSNNMAEIFDPNFTSLEAPLTQLELLDAEALIETHQKSRKIVTKSRVGSLKILSPPQRSNETVIDPASVLLAHKSFKGTPHIFYKMKDESTDKKEYMIQVRYEHPLHAAMNKKKLNSNQLYGHSYPMNPLLVLKLDGVHLGLNANSVFKVAKFLESRDNIFDMSPIEFMNQTVGKTVAVIKDKISKYSEVVKDSSESPATPVTPFTPTPNTPSVGIQTDFPDLPEDTAEDGTIRVDVASEVKKSEKSKRKLKAPRPFRSKSGRPVHPILWEVDVSNVEIFVLQDSEEAEKRLSSNAFGIELGLLKVQHNPIARANTTEELRTKVYSAHDLLKPSLKVSPPCYKTTDYDFAMRITGTNATFTTLAFNHEENRLFRTELSDPMSLGLELASDYNKPLDERAVSLHLSKYDPSAQIAPEWRVNITPQLLNAISTLVKGQVEEIKQFAFLLRFIRSPAADIADNFNRLQAELNRSQRAITRAMFCHDSLKKAVDHLQVEVAEKEEALQTAIQDKLRLTQMLAESMTAQHSKNNVLQQQQQQQQQPKLIQTQVPLQPQSQTGTLEDQPPVKESRPMILMEGTCSVLLTGSPAWKQVFGILMGTDLIFLTKRIALSEMRDPATRRKFMYSMIQIMDTTETFKTFAPVHDKEPKKVFFISNSETSTIYLNTENEQAMADWIRVIEKTVQTKKDEKEEAERIERERIESERREEEERIQKEEEERMRQEKLKQEEQERMNREREFDEQRNVATIGVQTDFDEQEENMDKNQRSLRHIDELLTQFSIMKEGLQAAKLEHDELVNKMTELTEYVKQLKSEEGVRLESIQLKVKQEAERAKHIDLIKQENADMRQQLMLKGQKILELERAVEKEKKTIERIKEEHHMLTDNMRLHFVVVEDQVNKAMNENKLLRRELEAYESTKPPQNRRKVSVFKPTERNNSPPLSDSDVNAELKLIIQDLYQQLAAKDDEIKHLKIKNVELSSRGPPLAAEASTQTGLSPAKTTPSLPPKPIVKQTSHGSLPPVPVATKKPLPPAPSNQPAPLIDKQKILGGLAAFKAKVSDKIDTIGKNMKGPSDQSYVVKEAANSPPKTQATDMSQYSPASTSGKDNDLLLDMSSPETNRVNSSEEQQNSL